jgi:hypothetical protein
MKIEIVTLAAVLAALLAVPAQAQTPPQRAQNLILAQSNGTATCKMDGRQMPQGMTYCRKGIVMRCSQNGTWEKTDKRC